jgi:hypothetical protein
VSVLLRRRGAGALERPGPGAVAADHHRHPACPGPPGRPGRGRAASAGPDLLCQGGRVPTSGRDPLPCGHPPGRGHRVPLPRLPGPATRAVHGHPARGGATAGGPGCPGALPVSGRWRAGPLCPLGSAARCAQHHDRRRPDGGAERRAGGRLHRQVRDQGHRELRRRPRSGRPRPAPAGG